MRALATPRLALEPLEARHAPEMFVALVDPALYRFMSERAPQSVELLAQRYARLESRESADATQAWLNWIVRVAGTGAAIGFVQATVHAGGLADVAYVIAGFAQRQGYGREATAAMIEELRARYGVSRLRASVDAPNAPSIALLHALGFQPGPAPGEAPQEARGGELFFYLG
jgi:RimJ/RimL family protein N-acetyltransferase